MYIIKRIILFVLSITIITPNIFAQSDDVDLLLDSMINEYHSSSDDYIRLSLLDSIAKTHYNADSTMKYAELELDLAIYLDKTLEQANALRFIAWSCYYQRKYTEAIPYIFKAIDIYEQNKSLDNLAKAYSQMANNLSFLSNYSEADKYYHKALNIFIERHDTLNISQTYRDLGHTCLENGLLSSAKTHFMNSLIINQNKNTSSLNIDFFCLAYYHHTLYESNHSDSLYNIAKNYYINAINHTNSSYNEDIKMRAHINLIDLTCLKAYYNQDSPRNSLISQAYNHVDSAFYYYKRYGYLSDSIDISLNKALTLALDKKFNDAFKILHDLDSFISNNDYGDASSYSNIYHTLSRCYELQNNYKQAFYYYKKYNKLLNAETDESYIALSTRSIAQLDYQNQLKQQQQIINAEQNAAKLMMIMSIIIITALIAISYTIWRSLIRRKRINILLDETNRKLAMQKEEIHTQNEYLSSQKFTIERQRDELAEAQKRTTESMQYALQIQKAAIPPDTLIRNIFGENFIFFKPLNIVSGDFYWAAQKNNLRFLAVADSTGHGIPGAFMAMLGMSILNSIIASSDINNITAAEILNTMRRDIKKSLRQNLHNNSNHDGIDICLCILNMDDMTIQYAGAFRPLWIVRNNSILEYKPDRMPIGIHIKEKESFTNNIIDIKHGDCLYLFSDGITDQFGYENSKLKKFTSNRLRQFILKNQALPMNGQKLAFDKLYNDWRTSYDINHESAPQTDDILIVGIRIN